MENYDVLSFWVQFILLSTINSNSTYFLQILEFHSFLWLNKSPLFIFTTKDYKVLEHPFFFWFSFIYSMLFGGVDSMESLVFLSLYAYSEPVQGETSSSTSFQNLPFFVYQEPLLTTLSFAAHGQIQPRSRISSLYTQCFEILLNFKHLGWWVERGRWWKPSLAWASGSFQPCLQLPIWRTDIIFVHWTWFGAVSVSNYQVNGVNCMTLKRGD